VGASNPILDLAVMALGTELIAHGKFNGNLGIGFQLIHIITVMAGKAVHRFFVGVHQADIPMCFLS
jgi:hypothetical protein